MNAGTNEHGAQKEKGIHGANVSDVHSCSITGCNQSVHLSRPPDNIAHLVRVLLKFSAP